jgi:hypothetical protein
MRILFDNGTPRGVAGGLPGHTVEEARSQGWDTLRNGELLDAAEAAGFDVFLTTNAYPYQLASPSALHRGHPSTCGRSRNAV